MSGAEAKRKLAERLSILNDYGEGMCARVHTIIGVRRYAEPLSSLHHPITVCRANLPSSTVGAVCALCVLSHWGLQTPRPRVMWAW